ncbi:hypothetical protein [Phytohabitans houttuyneae]|uniref:Uncharacterized protein n=1 Tax=Phytohabitans houttuyneae TaxID=1076126 RepID=A0A6V8KSS4_9ACTN|nr:hypothetical protein [Phytohabitans houttuyneae]GFJ84847.1 hypothetical protein Phou_090270 [Phytohabitans houttuyneae]
MADELERLIDLDDNELYGMLGKALGPKDFGPGDVQAYARLGRAWFQQHAKDLQQMICQSGGARVLLDGGERYDRLVEAASVADAVATILDRDTVYIFSVLVAKMGLAAFCQVGA